MKANNIHNSKNINSNKKRASSEITLKKRQSINENHEISFTPDTQSSSSDIVLKLMQREKDILVLDKTLSILKKQNLNYLDQITNLEIELKESHEALNSMISNYNDIYSEFIYETKLNMQLTKENKELKLALEKQNLKMTIDK